MKRDRDGKSAKRRATRYCLYSAVVVNDHMYPRPCAPLGLVIYSGNVPNGRDITNLCRHEPAVMAKGGNISRKTGL